MPRMKIRDLTPGDMVMTSDGHPIEVLGAWRNALFEGDVWMIETDGGGLDALYGGDEIEIPAKAKEDTPNA